MPSSTTKTKSPAAAAAVVCAGRLPAEAAVAFLDDLVAAGELRPAMSGGGALWSAQSQVPRDVSCAQARNARRC